MADLGGVLGGDPELAKREMQKRITKLVLTPIDTKDGWRYEVSGDLRLFAGPDDVMVNQSSPKLIDHYKAFVLPIKMMLKSARRGEGNQFKGDHGVETTLPIPSPCDNLCANLDRRLQGSTEARLKSRRSTPAASAVSLGGELSS